MRHAFIIQFLEWSDPHTVLLFFFKNFMAHPVVVLQCWIFEHFEWNTNEIP